MENMLKVAQELGYLKVPAGMLVDLASIKSLPKNKIVIVSTGSQGENMSALYRMAFSTHKQVDIMAGDRIIISASAIPGNEKAVSRIINELYRKGAEVVYEKSEGLHVSGHACQEELKIIHALCKPKFFIPVHGEYRHLVKHLELVKELGMRDSNALICEIGDTVELTPKSMRKSDKIPSGSRLVDGLSIDETQSVVRDRKHISAEGIVVTVCCVSAESGLILQEPDVIGKGAGLTDLQIQEIKAIILKCLDSYDIKSLGDKSVIRNILRKKIRDYIFKKTKKNPLILPIITEV
jgi:ribonuclease J